MFCSFLFCSIHLFCSILFFSIFSILFDSFLFYSVLCSESNTSLFFFELVCSILFCSIRLYSILFYSMFSSLFDCSILSLFGVQSSGLHRRWLARLSVLKRAFVWHAVRLTAACKSRDGTASSHPQVEQVSNELGVGIVANSISLGLLFVIISV